MLAELPNPIIFAHRGASAHAPENTLAAFELAVRQGADAIELDAKLTADGQVVVIHDRTVDRTTEGTGKVARLPLAALRELDAGSHFDVAFRRERIPTLAEVFEAVGRETYINIELTNYAQLIDRLPEKAAGLVKRHGMGGRVLFSSFNPLALLKIGRLVPEAPLGLLALPGKAGALFRSQAGRLIPHQALHPEKGNVTPALVEWVHQSQRRVHVYTVNEPESMRRLISWKVDGIITDDPVLARQVLAGVTG